MMTDGTSSDRIHLTVDQARALGEAAMRGAGFDNEDARILTGHVMDAALCGYEYSGLPKLLNVVDYPSFKLPRQPIRPASRPRSLLRRSLRRRRPEPIPAGPIVLDSGRSPARRCGSTVGRPRFASAPGRKIRVP